MAATSLTPSLTRIQMKAADVQARAIKKLAGVGAGGATTPRGMLLELDVLIEALQDVVPLLKDLRRKAHKELHAGSRSRSRSTARHQKTKSTRRHR